MTSKRSNHVQVVIGAFMVLCSLSSWALDDEFYYLLGGGEPVTRAASNRTATVELGGAVEWNTDLMCGNFDMSLSVEQQLEGIKGSFTDLMDNVISAASGAVASLPALVIQKANPALYDLLQNGVLQASEEFHLAQASCEDMVGAMDDVITNNGWESASRGGYWSGRSTNGDEILETRIGADVDGIDAGVIWVDGEMRGGRGQPPVALVTDAAKAGYNQVLLRNPGSAAGTAGTCGDAPICEAWASPQEFADWMVSVVGEKKIRTCAGCDKVATRAGMGLSHQMGVEQAQIASDLEALVNSSDAPTMDELEEVSGGRSMQISRRVVEAIREEKEHEQGMIINRLASEMALARTMEKAMIARRAMLAGMKEPNVANLQIAQDELSPFVEELEQEIENILFEIDVRQKIASNTAVQLLQRDLVRSQVPINEVQPASTFEDGATINP